MFGVNNSNSTLEARRRFPWFIWHLWKNRNIFGFEGKRFNALEIVQTISHEADSWFIADEFQVKRVEEEKRLKMSVLVKWPSQYSWVKCNIGVHWRKDIAWGGAAWVLRDSEGKVLLHSRRAFTGLNNLNELKVHVCLWAIDSMVSHKMNRVIFAFDDEMIVGAITRSMAWPSFKAMNKRRNISAFLIAQSVTIGERFQSYVAAGYLFWLKDIFENEKRLASP
ncbi:hypothetical protein Bca101_003667 [Brassica carinata]